MVEGESSMGAAHSRRRSARLARQAQEEGTQAERMGKITTQSVPKPPFPAKANDAFG